MQTSTIEIKTADGVMPAHLAEPDGAGPFPVVVVLMEAFGLVPQLKDVANRLAGEGYVTIAPDWYYRQLPGDNKASYDKLDEAIALMQTIDDDRFVDDMRATLSFLEGRPNARAERVGVTGFCMGGRLSFLCATALPERVACAAPFYGGGIVAHLAQADAIRCPLHLFFGEKDPYIPLEQVDQIDARLRELGRDYTIKVYPDADHGFFCDERASYQRAAATDSWEELKKLLGRCLG